MDCLARFGGATVANQRNREVVTDWQRFLLGECIEAYAPLDAAAEAAFEHLMQTKPYQEAIPIRVTPYEKGRTEGKLREARALLLRLGRKRFGESSPAIHARLEAITDIATLEVLADHLLDASDWADMLAVYCESLAGGGGNGESRCRQA